MVKNNIIRRNNRVAQTVIEYALLIAVSVGVLLVMHNYINRSLQGRLKVEIDKINPAGDYTLLSGRGVKSKNAIGVVWEHQKGHVVSWRSSSASEGFRYNLDDQIPTNFFVDPTQGICNGAECDLAAATRGIQDSFVGEQAYDYACDEGEGYCGQEDPDDDGISDSDIAEYEVISADIDSDLIQRYNNPRVIDADSVDINDPDNDGTSIAYKAIINGVVDENIGIALETNSSAGWARPLLAEEMND